MKFYGSINSSSPPTSPPIPATQKIHHLTKTERELLQTDRPGYGTRSKIEVAFNLVNATIGAGVIGLPFAIAHSGFFLGIIISIFVAALSQLGLYMIVLAGQTVGIYKFAPMVEYLLGRFGYHFLNTMIIIQAGGACISYFICKFIFFIATSLFFFFFSYFFFLLISYYKIILIMKFIFLFLI